MRNRGIDSPRIKRNGMPGRHLCKAGRMLFIKRLLSYRFTVRGGRAFVSRK